MKPYSSIIVLLFLTSIIACKNPTPISQTPLIQKDTTKILEKENTLFAFVGEKIELKDLPSEGGDFDNAYLATYRILQRVYGYFKSDTISFRVYSHKGFPMFAQFPYVLLYVSKGKSYYYHEKYQFNQVYQTKDGRWAGYSNDYNNQIDQDSVIKPQKIQFRDASLADSGNYVEDLFRLKKNGVLGYRGLFGDTIVIIPPVEIELIKDSSGLK